MTGGASGFVSVREMYAVRDAVLGQLREMEDRLTAKIESANDHHDRTHEDMRRHGDDRHNRLDLFLLGEERQEELRAAAEAGRSSVSRQAIGVLRTVNEFRALLGLALAAILLLTQNVHVSFQ